MTPKQRAAVAAVQKHGGVRAAARALGLARSTVQDAIDGASGKISRRRADRRPDAARAAAQVAGTVAYRRPVVRPLPAAGQVARYFVTSAQICTDVHAEFWRNLRAYAAHCAGTGPGRGPTEILVARFTYDQRAFSRPDLVKTRAAVAGGEGAYWYADEVLPHLCDGRVQLAPGLQFAGELNISPTAARPLSRLEGYTGRDSTIVPHAKLALESVPRAKGEEPKFLYTTGACTLRNYIQKRAGHIAEFHHAYAALIVEVLSDGTWWVRQLNATSDGAFADLDVRVADGHVRRERVIDGLHLGDVHASEQPEDIRRAVIGRGGLLDTLRPKYLFAHDLLSFRSASHHDRKSARKRWAAWFGGQASVAAELERTKAWLRDAQRPWCETIVVPSNHDEHADRWLDEGDPREDPQNSEIWHRANAAFRACARPQDWTFARWAFSGVGGARVLLRDESFTLHEIEMGWHGDLGPNGARGSTQSLLRTCRRISKGHDHQATLRDGVGSAGVCAYELDYARGPTSWSVTHIAVLNNGKRQWLTQRGRGTKARYWAPRPQKSPAPRKKSRK